MKLDEMVNADYEAIKKPAREVIKAYQDANRFLDTAQEVTYIKFGLFYLAKMLHLEAHEMPKRFDRFANSLHEAHIMAEYPETPELNWREEIKDVDDVFTLVVRILDNIHEKLYEFYEATDNLSYKPLALAAEELITENSKDYTKFIEAWQMYDKNGGSASYDIWIKEKEGL